MIIRGRDSEAAKKMKITAQVESIIVNGAGLDERRECIVFN
jgi:hypothetical protein